MGGIPDGAGRVGLGVKIYTHKSEGAASTSRVKWAWGWGAVRGLSALPCSYLQKVRDMHLD